MIDLVTGVMMLASVFYGEPRQSEVKPIEKKEASVQEQTTEQIVREYFVDTPIMIEVARCESTFKHIGVNGKVIRGFHNESDVGVMQINEFYHAEKAEQMGLDLESIDGNMAYAKWLYEKENLAPWRSSAKCWGKNPNREISRS